MTTSLLGRPRFRALCVVAAAGAAVLSGVWVAGRGDPVRPVVRVWVTSSDGAKRLARAPDIMLGGRARAATIQVTPRERHQTMLGMGGSLTESSAHLMLGLPTGERARLLDDLFSPSRGIGLSYVRIAIGSSDFVPSLPFTTHDASRDARAIVPLLREARRRNPHLRVMATPWSAPASMKDSGRLEGGSLRADALEAYADYLVGFVRSYARAGIHVDDLTVQNEPELATSYPSMTMSADQQATLMRVLDVKLTAAGLNTRLFAFDHNWDNPGYPLEVFAKAAGVSRLAGAAFHCYAGEPEAQAQVRAAGKQVLVTECSGTDTGTTTFGDTLRWQVERLIIRGPRSGAETALTWNLALDPHGGPEHGRCEGRCNGVVEIGGAGYTRNAEYYVLAHASRFMLPRAVRIGSTSAGVPDLHHVAFENRDHSRVLIVLNAATSRSTFKVADGARSFPAALAPGEVATYVWR